MNTFFTPRTDKMKWLLSCVIALLFLVSCTDETMLNSTDVKQATVENVGETSRIGILGNACVELADVSTSLGENTATTRAVSVNSRHLSLIEGSELKVRIFIVRAGDDDKVMVNGKEAVNPNKVVLGTGEMNWSNVEPKPFGTLGGNKQQDR